MNRRNFIKAAGVSALTTWTVTCKYKEKEHDPKGETGAIGETGWKYVVYCYEREQGEWVFSQNTRGSFNYQREYMTSNDEVEWQGSEACEFGRHKLIPIRTRFVGTQAGAGLGMGWMDQGKLHFQSLDDSMDFVEMHARVKDDVNLKDSIYDIYKLNQEGSEIKVAHYWFNGDTGRQINWVAETPHTDWNKVEGA